MARSKKRVRRGDTLPEDFTSLDEFWTFWNSHSTADYEHLMEDEDVHVDLHSSKTYCAVAKDIIAELRTQARRQGISTEALINLWLRDKVKETAQNK